MVISLIRFEDNKSRKPVVVAPGQVSAIAATDIGTEVHLVSGAVFTVTANIETALQTWRNALGGVGVAQTS